jgi:spoIIIJ-associated protein
MSDHIDDEALNEQQRIALQLMNEICDRLPHDVRPVGREMQGCYFYVELVGEDAQRFWGHAGKSLDALQFIANNILVRRVRGELRLVLDAGGYRERRAAVLRARALELAQEVKAMNQEAELEPLPPHERRIIHKALADDPDVRTYSEGEEPDRRIIISPRE